ncbi:unnamed protein product [Thlaspi arvense]|uniref:Uncharacterized protein n=1 Tax=Thlaspi arvense TaxID=13288 RepID=A0AAU9T918_THLAR|nr:unnamed protein product [Thlaspi arvense]
MSRREILNQHKVSKTMLSSCSCFFVQTIIQCCRVLNRVDCHDETKWVNAPPCDDCGSETINNGMGIPLRSESDYGASQVELYRYPVIL